MCMILPKYNRFLISRKDLHCPLIHIIIFTFSLFLYIFRFSIKQVVTSYWLPSPGRLLRNAGQRDEESGSTSPMGWIVNSLTSITEKEFSECSSKIRNLLGRILIHTLSVKRVQFLERNA